MEGARRAGGSMVQVNAIRFS